MLQDQRGRASPPLPSGSKEPDAEKLRKRQFTYSGLFWLLALLGLFAVHSMLQTPTAKTIAYDEMLTHVREGRVAAVELATSELRARLKADPGAGRPREEVVVTSRLPGIDETPLLKELEEKKITFSGRVESPSSWPQILLGWILPGVLLMTMYWGGLRRIGKTGGPLSFGKSPAVIHDKNVGERVTFADVAGVDSAKGELVEIVGFLKEPARYEAVGARAPKGVLLVGPPGTGKTLLARAVAGEADVPFFTLSGSDFVEMFVGVGAARVRDLFEKAKERSPCIVFIDELDAIGKTRGGGGGIATHDEREQTLNQLLVEMDGFDPGRGVVIMAATNRPEVLDQALLRAGRFDRQVVVDRPDLRDREEILRVHVRKIKMAEVDLLQIARRTPGMVGADLANVVNEAAMAAARRNATAVETHDFEEAIDRLQLGLRRKRRAMNPEEKRRVAFHEAGHALVALSMEHADPVHRVTIIPRSIGALGATLQLPTEDRYLMTRAELLDRIAVMLGGRIAEQLVLGDLSTGAENDLERATETARQMVCRFGMSDKLGPLTFGRPVGARFLEAPVIFGDDRNFSEETARAIDAEVRSIVETEHRRARVVLESRRGALSEIAERLLERETLERDEIETIAGGRAAEQTGRYPRLPVPRASRGR
jgi:cell division protease FtsH